MKNTSAKPWEPQNLESFKASRVRHLAEKAGTCFCDIWIDGDDIPYRGERHSLVGATATIEDAGELKRRVSATRVAL
ncbi:MAG: hypothetical protein ACRDRL_06650, partial [Sciscionella sp.]